MIELLALLKSSVVMVLAAPGGGVGSGTSVVDCIVKNLSDKSTILLGIGRLKYK